MESRAPSPDTAASSSPSENTASQSSKKQQIEAISRSELDGYIQALARLHGKNPSAGE
ncbi:MAG: hypothetical protein ACMZI0_02320 [Symbiopectobacterium sp.]|uniref:hypothetical protein n=1 Tax=Symbiopectobacterium sp. TaxID=2952789 RepID=UPI0039E8508E